MRNAKRTIATRGFAIIEVVFMLVVIAILAIAILLLYNNMREKARDSQRMVDLQTINSAMHQMYGDQNRYKSPDVVAAYLIEKKFINIIPTDPYPYRDQSFANIFASFFSPHVHAAEEELNTICHVSFDIELEETIEVETAELGGHFYHGDYLGECDGRTDWEDADKVIICHVTGSEPQTMSVKTNNVTGHLNHGDYYGECEEPDQEWEEDEGSTEGSDGEETGKSFELCHRSGNNEHALNVSQASVQAHLAHGDYEGICDGRTLNVGVLTPDCETEICGKYNYVYGVADDPSNGEYGQYFEVSAAFESDKNAVRLEADEGNDDERFEIGNGTPFVNTHFLDPDGLPAGQNLFETEIISARVLAL